MRIKRDKIRNYLILGIVLVLMSISSRNSDKIRGLFVAALGPLWEFFANIRGLTIQATAPSSIEAQRLLVENQMLKVELHKLREFINEDFQFPLDTDFQAVPAKVILRSPAAWDHFLWINIGENTNAQIKKEVVLKNSPVVVGNSVVGVIDYVGKTQSRVRLITDSELPLSVRVKRNELLLAKGELQGALKKGKTGDYLLKGVGFNYDFKDEAGPARDLRNGKPAEGKGAAMPLLKSGDLLVTTGLDGVFPAGLHVGRIHKIYPLKEGDYFYELEAKPTMERLDDLYVVFVLKPMSYDAQ